MQTPNAQGLAGLMSQPRAPQPPQVRAPQGQPPMPTPSNASPMAGLGSVESRVAAYRGNPAPLQQRYAMSQDLLDLLALQKIKSEKDAAARQMQLAMSQQQASQGMEPMTVAQQREKEVMDMTKNELAQQRGETAQQQTAQQQAALQRVMSGGIAAAPGANTAAQPKAMASGGIVAFAEGGTPPGKKPLDEEARRELAQAEGDRKAMLDTVKKLAAAGYDVATLLPRGVMGAFESVVTRPLRALGVPIPYLPESAYGGDRTSMTPMMDRLRRAEAQEEPATSVSTTPPAATTATTPAPTVPAGPAGPSGASGVASLPAAQGSPAAPRMAAPAMPAQTPIEKTTTDFATRMMNLDPAARQLEEEKRIEGRLAFPEEQERRRAYVEQQRKMYEQEFDPERQRSEALTRFLIGAGGRRYGELAGGAGAAMDYETAQRAAQRERLKGIEDYEQGLFGLRKAAVEGGIGAGQKTVEQLREQQKAGALAGTSLSKSAADERQAAAQNAIERLKIAATNAATAAQRENLTFTKRQALYATTVDKLRDDELAIKKLFEQKYGILQNAGSKLKPEQQQALDAGILERDRQLLELKKGSDAILGQLRQQLGLSDLVQNMTPEQRKLVEKWK